MKYDPNPQQPKDELKHDYFWKLKGWKDPCKANKSLRASFNKCSFKCQVYTFVLYRLK